MKKRGNFYKLLNIDREATPSEIKKAYRKAAKRYHPDVSSRDDGKFGQIQEAYETLSDPEKKMAYDRDLRSLEPPGSKHQYSFQDSDTFFSIFNHFDSRFFDLNDLGSDLRRYELIGGRKRFIEIILTPDEARKGGEISLKFPFQTPCGRCMGTGRTRGLICGRCRGDGEEAVEKSVTISIPSGVRDGTRSSIPVNILGARIDLFVTVKIRQVTKTRL